MALDFCMDSWRSYSKNWGKYGSASNDILHILEFLRFNFRSSYWLYPLRLRIIFFSSFTVIKRHLYRYCLLRSAVDTKHWTDPHVKVTITVTDARTPRQCATPRYNVLESFTSLTALTTRPRISWTIYTTFVRCNTPHSLHALTHSYQQEAFISTRTYFSLFSADIHGVPPS